MARQLARGEVAGAAVHGAVVALGADLGDDARPEPVGRERRVRAGVELDPEPAADAGRLVEVEGGRTRVGGDHEVHVAVVLDVEAGDRAPFVTVIEPGPRRHLGEGGYPPVAVAVEQPARLIDVRAALGRAPVDLQDVEPGVVVEVHGDRAPAPVAVVDAGQDRTLEVGVVVQVDVEHVAGIVRRRRGAVDRGDVPVEQPVVVEVADGLPHAVVVEPGSGEHRQVGEGSVSVVHQVAACLEVGRDQQLRVPVAVHVDERRLKAPDAVHRRAQRRRGDIGERAVAVVPVEPGAVITLGVGLVAAPPRRHAQVEVAVEVVVAERGAVAGGVVGGNRAREVHARRRGDVGEARARVVAVQAVRSGRSGRPRRAEARHVDVLPPVLVVVAHGDAVAAVQVRDPPRRGLVDERSVAVVHEQLVRGQPAAHPENVHQAVVVEILDGEAAGHPLLRGRHADLVGLVHRDEPGVDRLVAEHYLPGRGTGDKNSTRQPGRSSARTFRTHGSSSCHSSTKITRLRAFS